MEYLSDSHFSTIPASQRSALASGLDEILNHELKGSLFELMGSWQRILADNSRRHEWPEVHEKLHTLFMAGKAMPLDGPMIGCTMSIRDSDYWRDCARLAGRKRSSLANIEWMATAWNLTFAGTGLWMGKTFEPVSLAIVEEKTDNDIMAMRAFDPNTTRIGRNFFREPHDPNLVQSLGLPALTRLWNLVDRPTPDHPMIFETRLTERNAEKERLVPYTKTGGLFLADLGNSVVPEMNGKAVYQLNYRWPRLKPVFPMTRLVDEVVQIGDGLYLGQLVFATKHYALWTLDINGRIIQLGEDYAPNKPHHVESDDEFAEDFPETEGITDYGYQNNGFFLMMDPSYSDQIYADGAFPELRPRKGEHGYEQLQSGKPSGQQAGSTTDTSESAGATATTTTGGFELPENYWVDGWWHDEYLANKFTCLLTEPSPKEGDAAEDVQSLRRENESVLQMLKRISEEITATTRDEDNIAHFEQLNRLFRAGIAPGVSNGLFQRAGLNAFNVRLDGTDRRTWYGKEDPLIGLDYYHGANLNLHCGFGENFHPQPDAIPDDEALFPGILSEKLVQLDKLRGKMPPNILNEAWHSLGKYLFPWAGKSFETVSPRKLSMLLDESDNLRERYPQRAGKIATSLASAMYYKAIKQNEKHALKTPGRYQLHLDSGSWDTTMSDEDREFWRQQASDKWVLGYNLQDSRILGIDSLMRSIDINYRSLDPAVQWSANEGPSPFVRQGYMFLGGADQNSILPMNNGDKSKKKVFQFNYRYPMTGGPAPINYCLDELVEIADGLFLGQLIYSTRLDKVFHSSMAPAKYRYQLFGYFLLLDDEWQRHRLAIGLDTL